MNEQTKPKDRQITPHPLKRYYRVGEVAQYFAISERTVYRLIYEGELKTIRIRDCIRIPVEEIQEFEKRWLVEF